MVMKRENVANQKTASATNSATASGAAVAAAPGTASARKVRDQWRRLSRLTEAQAALGWGIILILVAVLGLIYLSQTSRIAMVGRRVQFLQEDLDVLQRNNAALERKIAEAQSLERLQREAVRLGFVPADPEAIEYIIVENYPVMPAAEKSAETVLRAPPETMSQALWLLLRSSMTDFMRGESRQ